MFEGLYGVLSELESRLEGVTLGSDGWKEAWNEWEDLTLPLTRTLTLA